MFQKKKAANAASGLPLSYPDLPDTLSRIIFEAKNMVLYIFWKEKERIFHILEDSEQAIFLKPFTSKGLGGLALSMKTNYQTKPPQIMKTIITLIAAGFILNTSNVTAQSTASINNDGITAAEGKVPSLIISEVNFKALRNGYNVTWETQNQFNVASFELQISENNKNFSTVKRRTCGPEKRSKYQVQLSNTLILANPVFYRLKWVTMDGQVNYTESKQFTNDL